MQKPMCTRLRLLSLIRWQQNARDTVASNPILLAVKTVGKALQVNDPSTSAFSTANCSGLTH